MINLFLPYRFVSFETSLTADEAAKLLAAEVSSTGFFSVRFFGLFSKEKQKRFEGSVSSRGFTINRAVYYFDYFFPVLFGNFRATAAGTRVNVRMTLHPAVFALIAALGFLWCLFSGLLFLPDTSSFSSFMLSIQIGLAPIFAKFSAFQLNTNYWIALAAFYFLLMFFFWLEVYLADRFINKIKQ